VVLEKYGENQFHRVENKYCKESFRKGTSYTQYKEGRVTGLVTSCTNFTLKRVIEGEVEERIEVMGGRGRRRQQLLGDLREMRSWIGHIL
jgi:hypothetical protein